MNKDERIVFGCFGLLVLAVFATIFRAIWNGWVLTVLWEWFITPIFSIRTLTIAEAIGISLVAGILTHQSTDLDSDNKDVSEIIGAVVARVTVPALTALVIGRIVIEFM